MHIDNLDMKGFASCVFELQVHSHNTEAKAGVGPLQHRLLARQAAVIVVTLETNMSPGEP